MAQYLDEVVNVFNVNSKQMSWSYNRPCFGRVRESTGSAEEGETDYRDEFLDGLLDLEMGRIGILDDKYQEATENATRIHLSICNELEKSGELSVADKKERNAEFDKFIDEAVNVQDEKIAIIDKIIDEVKTFGQQTTPDIEDSMMQLEKRRIGFSGLSTKRLLSGYSNMLLFNMMNSLEIDEQLNPEELLAATDLSPNNVAHIMRCATDNVSVKKKRDRELVATRKSSRRRSLPKPFSPERTVNHRNLKRKASRKMLAFSESIEETESGTGISSPTLDL